MYIGDDRTGHYVFALRGNKQIFLKVMLTRMGSKLFYFLKILLGKVGGRGRWAAPRQWAVLGPAGGSARGTGTPDASGG